MRAAPGVLVGLLLALPAGAAPREERVLAGKYYVGKAMGERDFKALANASTPGFLVFRSPVTEGLFSAALAWGTLHGYVFGPGCAGCVAGADDRPVTGVSWRDAALFANALSERDGLDAVYRDAGGRPVRDEAGLDRAIAEPTLGGWRLPTIPEWQVALRGADRALAEGSYGAPPRSPNALGLEGAAGPLAEWTASSMDLGEARTTAFVCNLTLGESPTLSNCEARATGSSDAAVGFRLVRPLPAEPVAPPQERRPSRTLSAPSRKARPREGRRRTHAHSGGFSMSDPYDLRRFVEAQAPVYTRVLDELRAGRKTSHWMWFVFPQIEGLGSSPMAMRYAIGSLAEAQAYLGHDLLGARLLECTALVNGVEGRSINAILGRPDDLKFRSSMTLFARAAADGAPFLAALDRFFAGEADPATLARLR